MDSRVAGIKACLSDIEDAREHCGGAKEVEGCKDRRVILAQALCIKPGVDTKAVLAACELTGLCRVVRGHAGLIGINASVQRTAFKDVQGFQSFQSIEAPEAAIRPKMTLRAIISCMSLANSGKAFLPTSAPPTRRPT